MSEQYLMGPRVSVCLSVYLVIPSDLTRMAGEVVGTHCRLTKERMPLLEYIAVSSLE